MPFADLALARRLERAEGDASRRFVEAHARVAPESGAEWQDVGGTYAMFDGVESPLTQTFGLGLFELATAPQLEQIEQFFEARGAVTYHEVSPLAEGTLPLLHARGYEPFEYTSVMCQPINRSAADAQSVPSSLGVRRIEASEQRAWAATAADGWGETPGLRDFMLAFGLVIAAAQQSHAFVAELNGQMIATAAMMAHDGVALLAGASTVPGARRHGAQAALLDARLAFAAAMECDLAMMCASPGSTSQRNAERNGFRICYTRLKWRRQAGGR
jgi:hypothetical protein